MEQGRSDGFSPAFFLGLQVVANGRFDYFDLHAGIHVLQVNNRPLNDQNNFSLEGDPNVNLSVLDKPSMFVSAPLNDQNNFPFQLVFTNRILSHRGNFLNEQEQADIAYRSRGFF